MPIEGHDWTREGIGVGSFAGPAGSSKEYYNSRGFGALLRPGDLFLLRASVPIDGLPSNFTR